MATTYKVLGQSAPSATTATTLYTVPSATATVVSSINVVNTNSSTDTIRIAIRPAGASSVTFSGIPQTGYTDLVVRCSTRHTGGGVSNYHNISLNGSAASFTGRFIEGSGSAASSGTSQSAGLDNGGGATASTFSNTEYYIPNYTSANYKSYNVDSVTETNAVTQYMTLVAGLWSNTAAITSVGITPQSGNLAQYSTFYLYGVAALGTTPAIVPYATGGDTIMTDGTYWYHAFKANGTFTPAKALSCDVLVVAGGGSGGSNANANTAGGGGGSGGVLAFTSQSFSSGQTVTIGSGGAASNTNSPGNVGNDSQFGALTLVKGGGYGGSASSGAGIGGVGGSGGGAGTYFGASAAGGTATSGQGSAGGVSYTNNYAGGGGGAGAVGGAGISSASGAGGGGLNTWSSWATATSTGVSGYYAGGGGGGYGGSLTGFFGAAGSGGGGRGATGGTTSDAGTANTGGGGGGNGYTTGFGGAGVGGAGGSGLVIVRYAV